MNEIKTWIEDVLGPALAKMPGGSIGHLEYEDNGYSQIIAVVYNNGYKREVNVTMDSARACLIDMVNQGVIK